MIRHDVMHRSIHSISHPIIDPLPDFIVRRPIGKNRKPALPNYATVAERSRWFRERIGRSMVVVSTIIASLVSAGSLVAESPLAESPVAETPLGRTIDSEVLDGVRRSLRDDLRYLASDELRGRGTSTDAIDIAADYVAKRMTEIGLRTDAVDGGAFQMVEVPLGSKAGPADKNRFRVTVGDETLVADLNQSFMPLSAGAATGMVEGGVVFAGYGITAEEHDYDDYASIDAEGKIVIVLRKEPGMTDPDSPFDGTQTTRYALFASKIANAIEHGAAGMLIVNDRVSTEAMVGRAESRLAREKANAAQLKERIETIDEGLPKIRKSFEDQLEQTEGSLAKLTEELERARRGVLGLNGAGRRSKQTRDFPVASLGRDIADRLLKSGDDADGALSKIEAAIDEDYQPRSRMIADDGASLSVDVTPSSRTSPNVIGVIDPKDAGEDDDWTDETIVIGAHYDHVGMGGEGSLAPGTVAVHNGADDNASGTTALLGVAKLLSERLAAIPDHRRVVLMTFTGEERGLIGSKHYVDNPLFPIESTAAMINMDMVGRLRDNELTVYGTGSGDKMDAILESANKKESARSEAFNLFKVETGYGPSDHQSFFVAGVPVLFFFTGLHDDYHRPSDDFDKINFTGLTRITDTVCDVAVEVATDPVRPTHRPTDRQVNIRRQLRVVLGVRMSDDSEGDDSDGDGVLISDVTKGSTADRGGIRTGDRLTRLGKTDLATPADLLGALRRLNPGDEVTAEVDRDGNRFEATLTMDARP